MSRIDGYYYLHTNGDLIFKKVCPEIEPGGFVRMVWPVDLTDRGNAWVIVIEAGALGAKKERIEELREKWGLTDEDAFKFAEVCEMELKRDDDGFVLRHPLDDIEKPLGKGKTALDAFINYARCGDLILMSPQIRKMPEREKR